MVFATIWHHTINTTSGEILVSVPAERKLSLRKPALLASFQLRRKVSSDNDPQRERAADFACCLYTVSIATNCEPFWCGCTTGHSEQEFGKVSDPIRADTSRCLLSSVRLACDADDDLLCDEDKRRADIWTTPTPLSRVAEKRRAEFAYGFERGGECESEKVEDDEEVWEDIDDDQEGEGEEVEEEE
jgi:hypothetical protein